MYCQSFTDGADMPPTAAAAGTHINESCAAVASLATASFAISQDELVFNGGHYLLQSKTRKKIQLTVAQQCNNIAVMFVAAKTSNQEDFPHFMNNQ